MTPQLFIAKWGAPHGIHGPAYALNEEQGAQSHFLDLCELLGVPKPGSAENYKFEEKNAIIGGRTGYADVFMRGVFAWENKAPGRNLDAALRQLLTYSLALSNPPILVVSDRLRIRIHTQFTGHPSQTHEVRLEELDQPDKLALLRRIWTAPESFKPRETNRDITEAAARSFAALADGLRQRGARANESKDAVQQRANQVAHFLTQCLFCFFAEDVGLLPGRMFERLVNNQHINSERLTKGLSSLFTTMKDGGMFGADSIPWFNGGLFKSIAVPQLQPQDVKELRNAAGLNWSAIDVSIFGTLFERGLDPAKRSQLGAHYTDPATILRIVEPVVQRPLLQLWEQEKAKIEDLLGRSTKRQSASIKLPGRRKTQASAGDKHFQQARQRFLNWLEQLANYRVLDPACGSGNFLFLGLKALKDIEHKSHLEAAALGLDREADLVTGPHNVLGIELNEYAAELARVTVWIGELQWRLAHGYEFKTNPILEPLEHIECRDALLAWQLNPLSDTTGAMEAIEAPWPKASVVIGNPPFLGDRKMIRELGETYTFALRNLYNGRVPGGADLVCYWFEKARKAIETNGLGAAGLVATNSIRGGANRKVLDDICSSTRIYEAWSDETWVNDGAAVRVSLVAFGHADQQARLDGADVEVIYADLNGQQGVGEVRKLIANSDASYIGTQKNGPFDIPRDVAVQWLRLPNPHGNSNAAVVRPWANGLDVTRRPQDRWVVDFGCDMPLEKAALYEAPFAYVDHAVKPTRAHVRRDWHRTHWWLYGDARPGLRQKLSHLSRFIVTPMVAKHRVFAWMPAMQIPENLCVAITRADDTTFGILHSRFHEMWSLRMCTWLGVGNDPRYTPTTCFETFPFPAGLAPADTAHQRTEAVAGGAWIPADLAGTGPSMGPGRTAWGSGSVQAKGMLPRDAATAIAMAAHRLNQLREAWLNPPEWTHRVPEVIPLGMSSSPYPDRTEPRPGLDEATLKALQKRTLTNLYNQRPAWLAMAHEQLDRTVAAAYGWTDYTPAMPDEEVLRRLLALNLERAGG